MQPNQQTNSTILTPAQHQERFEFERTQTIQLVHMLQSQVSERIAKSHYCVMNAARTTIVKDPGLSQPFFTPYKKRAEEVAKSVRGVVETIHDALRYLLKANQVSQ